LVSYCKHLAETENRVQRRAKLVAHGRQKLGFGAARLFRLFLGQRKVSLLGVAVGDVEEDANDAAGLSARLAVHRLMEDDVVLGAVRVRHGGFVDLAPAFRQQVHVGLVIDPGQRLRRDAIDRLADDLGLFPPEKSLESCVAADIYAVLVLIEHRHGNGVDQGFQQSCLVRCLPARG
jgi:hypothetical protein